VLQRRDSERWTPDRPTSLEVDLVHQLPRIASAQVGESLDADHDQTHHNAGAAEVDRDDLLALRIEDGRAYASSELLARRSMDVLDLISD
jgi:hypothetical protein